MLPKNLSSKAHELWRTGQTLQAGEIIFENLPLEARPEWAAGVLRLALNRTGVKSSAIEDALRIAASRTYWIQAHNAFSTLRTEILELDNLKALKPEQALRLHLLALAELVAKVTYNSTEPIDEFDADSGWWIAPCLKDILDFVNDEEFSRSAWSAMSQ